MEKTLTLPFDNILFQMPDTFDSWKCCQNIRTQAPYFDRSNGQKEEWTPVKAGG